MSEQNVNGDVSSSDIYLYSSAEAQERAFKGKIKQLSGDIFIFTSFVFCLKGYIYKYSERHACQQIMQAQIKKFSS